MSILKKAFFLGTLLFFILIPFHAFLVTFTNALFWDANFSPPWFLSAWKEIFLLLLISLWLILFSLNAKNFCKKWDTIDSILLAFFVWAISIGVLETSGGWKQILWGIKYDLFPLALFALFRKGEYTEKEEQRIFSAFLLSSVIVILFGAIQKVLPPDFLVRFGYSPEHSHFSPERPLAYCQMISETHLCRIQSFLSGPNQLGAFLILALPLFIQKAFSKITPIQKWMWGTLVLLGFFDLFFSFSRSAWIGMASIVAIFFLFEKRQYLTKKIVVILWMGAVSGILLISTLFPVFFEKILTRSSSNQGHWERSLDGVRFLFENPWGLGLGDAGPASNRFAPENLGFIPENWHLQIALETGFLGLFLYWIFLIFVGRKLIKTPSPFGKALFLGLIGISMMGIFLHSWESAETAYSFWILAGIACSQNGLLSKKIEGNNGVSNRK